MKEKIKLVLSIPFGWLIGSLVGMIVYLLNRLFADFGESVYFAEISTNLFKGLSSVLAACYLAPYYKKNIAIIMASALVAITAVLVILASVTSGFILKNYITLLFLVVGCVWGYFSAKSDFFDE